MTDISEFQKFANDLADEAGKIIAPLFRTPVAIEVKSDRSPVTIADKKAEEVMRKMIMKRYPAHGIWGEEFGKHQADAEYCWVLDPVDGTQSFISGFPTFGTLISLARSGVPILGIINQPVSKERWLGIVGKPTTFNGKPVKTRACPKLKMAAFSTTSPHYFKEKDKAKIARLQHEAHATVYGYDCYAYAQLASGFIDLIAEDFQPHDFCALVSVVEGAGGVMTDWAGKKLTLASDGRVIAAGDARVHAQALEILRE